MAARTSVLRRARSLLYRSVSSSSFSAASVTSAITTTRSPPSLEYLAGVQVNVTLFSSSSLSPYLLPLSTSMVPLFSQRSTTSRGFSSAAFSGGSDITALPSFSDAAATKALKSILAVQWSHLDHSVLKELERVMASSSDEAAKRALKSAKVAAEAVETFLEKLESLRMNLDELSGGKFGGEVVQDIPEDLKQALTTALARYSTYLDSFGADEEWLRKKVQEEVGGALLPVKQRCSGLEPEWNKISLLGTSGLSGSYIERRA